MSTIKSKSNNIQKITWHVLLGVVLLFSLIAVIHLAKESNAVDYNSKFLGIKLKIKYDIIPTNTSSVVVISSVINNFYNRCNNVTCMNNVTTSFIDLLHKDPIFVTLFVNNWVYLYNINATLTVSMNGICVNHNCTQGQYDRGRKEVTLFSNNIDGTEELIYVFLHEVGHLIYYNSTIFQERYEWVVIHNSSTEVLREYTKNDPVEDFADSYAFYRLGKEFDKNKIKFIEKVIKKADKGEGK